MRLHNMLRNCLAVTAASLIFIPANVRASNAGPGMISDMQIDGNSVVFAVSGSRTTKPACAIWDRYVFSLTATNGPAMLAFLLTAQSQGKPVIVYGTSTCSIVSDHETASAVRNG